MSSLTSPQEEVLVGQEMISLVVHGGLEGPCSVSGSDPLVALTTHIRQNEVLPLARLDSTPLHTQQRPLPQLCLHFLLFML